VTNDKYIFLDRAGPILVEVVNSNLSGTLISCNINSLYFSSRSA